MSTSPDSDSSPFTMDLWNCTLADKNPIRALFDSVCESSCATYRVIVSYRVSEKSPTTRYGVDRTHLQRFLKSLGQDTVPEFVWLHGVTHSKAHDALIRITDISTISIYPE